jgi:hypothetical protein
MLFSDIYSLFISFLSRRRQEPEIPWNMTTDERHSSPSALLHLPLSPKFEFREISAGNEPDISPIHLKLLKIPVFWDMRLFGYW